MLLIGCFLNLQVPLGIPLPVLFHGECTRVLSRQTRAGEITSSPIPHGHGLRSSQNFGAVLAELHPSTQHLILTSILSLRLGTGLCF